MPRHGSNPRPKTLKNKNKTTTPRRFTSLTGTAKVLYAENGVTGFYRGWHWRTTRMALAILIMGQCKETLVRMLTS